MECSEVMESDGCCVKRRKELLINWAGNVKSDDQVIVYYPRTVVGLQSIVRLSKEKEVGVRVVGARHSWSRALLQIPQNTLLVSLLSKNKPTELSFVAQVEEQGDGVAEVEVGAGATLGQLAEQCRKSGWQLASAPALPQVTVAGVAVSLSHGAGIGRPGLADSVTALTYIDVHGEVQMLTEAEEVAVFLSSLGLLGIIVSLRVRLVHVERVRAPLQSPIDDLSLLLPRPGEDLPPQKHSHCSKTQTTNSSSFPDHPETTQSLNLSYQRQAPSGNQNLGLRIRTGWAWVWQASFWVV